MQEEREEMNRSATRWQIQRWLRITLSVLGAQVLALALIGAVLERRSSAHPGSDGQLLFHENFDGPEALSATHQAEPDQGYQAGRWEVRDGRLYAEKIHNAALWFSNISLPADVRIEFTAWAGSAKGDVKCEIFGDGRTHQSGYVVIAGGWSNSSMVIARQDEHGEERRQDRRCSAARGALCVPEGQGQRWVIERRGELISWFVDGQLQLRLREENPVTGSGFAFNNWEAPVSFDELRIYEL